jgi:branched-chain amino acid aminotransferase/4-amino-4-deoxychorismate lyase
VTGAVAFDDRGLTLGDGLFETILVRDGQPVLWQEHLERMAAGCAVLALPDAPLMQAADLGMRALEAADLMRGRAALRLTLTAGAGGRGLDRPDDLVPRLFATAAPAPMPATPARAIVSSVRRNAGSPASRLKSLSYLDNVLARRQARAAGADEAVMLNTDGHVACAAAANLFWLSGGMLVTPALECGVLAGLMRAAVIGRARSGGIAIIEEKAELSALAGAEAVWLTNSLVGVRPVAWLHGRGLAPHPLTETLCALAADLV